jgi:NADH-ubiquinone oxidoreductase chain 4
MLLAVLYIISTTGTGDFDALVKINFDFTTQMFLFAGIFFAFAIKTPTIFLNS